MWSRKETIALLTGQGARRALRILVVFVPLTWIVLSDQATGSFKPIRRPVDAAVIATDHERNHLRLDADRNGFHADFPHKQHMEELAKLEKVPEEETCIKCHHLSLPNDHNTSCRRCHRDMELDTRIFDLGRHRDRFESAAEYEEFTRLDLDDPMTIFAACMECHEETMPGLVEYEKKGFGFVAPGYKYAMHGTCLTCHRLRERELKEDPANPESRSNCLFCHRQWADEGMFKDAGVGEGMSQDAGVGE